MGECNASSQQRLCSVDGCDDYAGGRSTMCWAHRKRMQRHGCIVAVTVKHRGGSPFERLLAAAVDLAEVEADDDSAWELAVHRFRAAARRYRSSGAG
jgi:hypothetical protein